MDTVTQRRPPPARVGRARRASALVALLSGLWLLAAGTTAGAQTATVAVTTVDGAITPVIADHLSDTVAQAEREGHVALVVRLDTPGGLISSMRDIVQTFLAADIPIVVHVSPSGADAGSAGTFITLSAHVAAMAPATTIGAATPVDLEGGEVGDKIVENAAAYAEAIAEARGRDVDFAVASVREGRSITADAALEAGAIDVIAPDLRSLLEAIDGRTVTLDNGTTVTLDTAGAAEVELGLSGIRNLLQRLADPNLAFIFISIGTLAILYEVANPGVGAGGAVGIIMLVLAFFSLSVLPVNIAGLALLALAGALFIGEMFVPGVGIMAGMGALALLLGGLLLFQRPAGVAISLALLLPAVLVTTLAAVGVAVLAARTRDIADTTGEGQLVGRTGRLKDAVGTRGRIAIDGTNWRARSADGQQLHPGGEIRVVAMDGLDLVVEPTSDDADPAAEEHAPPPV